MKELKDPALLNVCRDFMQGKCAREKCRYIHDTKLCKRYFKNGGSCKFKENCRKNHFVTGEDKEMQTSRATRPKRMKNTESFVPYDGRYDLRIVMDTAANKLDKELGDGDVGLCPRVFEGYKPGELYDRLKEEIENTDIPIEELLKLWHGNDKIEGTHLIANDRTGWKEKCPTFKMVIDRLREYFGVRVEATRLNWYKGNEQFKPLHHDSAYINPEKAKKQNITVAVSFGQTRDIIFQHAKSRDVICVPQGDGEVYTFGNDVNSTYRHGVQPGKSDSASTQQGRISVIIWGWKGEP